MYLFLAIVSAAIGMSFSHGYIGDVRFSDLTINVLLDNLLAGACYTGAVLFGAKSLQADIIWPWNWQLFNGKKKLKEKN